MYYKLAGIFTSPISSVGRASDLQAGSHGFEPHIGNIISSYYMTINLLRLVLISNLGARYTRDKTMFQDQLKSTMNEVNYKRVYLFLGSNDVLNSELVFYR